MSQIGLLGQLARAKQNAKRSREKTEKKKLIFLCEEAKESESA